MSEILQARYDQLVRRVANLVGPGSKVNDVISELIPVVDLERVPMELLRLGGIRSGVAGAMNAAGAGQFQSTQLFNPVDSNVIATVTSVFLSVDVGATVLFNVDLGSVGVQLPNAPQLRDNREVFPNQPTCQLFQTGALVAPINADGQFRAFDDHMWHMHDPNGIAVLAPGGGLAFGLGESSKILWTTFLWRERSAEASELSL